MIIRKLNETDKASLEGLFETIDRNLENRKFWLPVTDASRDHFFDEEWTVFYGAFEGDDLVAAAALFLNENEFGESKKHIGYDEYKVAEIGRIMCDPAYRSTGLPTAILRNIISDASELDLDYLIATAHPENIPSQKVLAKSGFEKAGYIVKSNDFERDILVRKM